MHSRRSLISFAALATATAATAQNLKDWDPAMSTIDHDLDTIVRVYSPKVEQSFAVTVKGGYPQTLADLKRRIVKARGENDDYSAKAFIAYFKQVANAVKRAQIDKTYRGSLKFIFREDALKAQQELGNKNSGFTKLDLKATDAYFHAHGQKNWMANELKQQQKSKWRVQDFKHLFDKLEYGSNANNPDGDISFRGNLVAAVASSLTLDKSTNKLAELAKSRRTANNIQPRP